jgi:hypothetical protein
MTSNKRVGRTMAISRPQFSDPELPMRHHDVVLTVAACVLQAGG